MTPIQASDRPKIITLGVLSVIMFGYFAKTLFGAMGDHAAAATPPTPTPPPATPLAVSASAPAAPVPQTVAQTTAPAQVVETGGPAEPFRKVLPEPGQHPNASAPQPQINIGKGAGEFPKPMSPMPVMGGGLVATPSPVVRVEPAIRLDGVVTDSENCAVVSIGDKSDLYRAGRKIAGVYKLISVDEQGASFRGPSGVFHLEVGQQHAAASISPPAPQSAGNSPAVAQTAGMLPFPIVGK